MKEGGGGRAIFRAVFDPRNSTETLATQAIKVPPTPILIFSRKRRFFSPFWPFVHPKAEFLGTKNAHF